MVYIYYMVVVKKGLLCALFKRQLETKRTFHESAIHYSLSSSLAPSLTTYSEMKIAFGLHSSHPFQPHIVVAK